MPKKEGGASHLFIILGVAALAGLLLYLSGSLNKNQKITPETPKQTQEQAKEEIKDVPNPINDFLNNNDIGEYEKAGMKIYTGNNPPNIEGLYKSDSLVVFYDKPFENEAPVGTEVSNYNHQFTDQKSDGTIKLKRIPLEGEDTAEGMGGFISGNNSCFSIFVNVQDQSDQCNTNQATIYSACKTEEGLEDLQAGFILKEQEGPGCGKVVPVGHLRIITEDDGLAEWINKNEGDLN
jgi:hypothetical protein